MQELISDDDIFRSVKMDEVKTLANIVGQTGATANAFFSAFYKDERHERTLVDIGVLRFPNIEKPFIQVREVHCIS